MANLERLPRDIDRYMMLSAIAGAERAAVLPDGDRAHRSDHAAHLHADGRRGLQGVLAHRTRPEGLLHHSRRSRRNPAHPRQLARKGHPGHRRHRRPAHPGTGRPGCERHGHSGGQAGALHRLCRNRSGSLPARDARRRHEQRRAPEGRAVSGVPAPAASGEGLLRSRRRVRDGRAVEVSGRADPVRGFPHAERVCAAGEIQAPGAVLQRRHPGHGCGRPGGCLHVNPGHGHSVPGSPDHVPGRGLGRDGNRGSDDQRLR